MERYEEIGSKIQLDILGKTLDHLVNIVSSTPYIGKEIKFVKVNGTDHTYKTYALKNDENIPNLKDIEYVSIGKSDEIGGNLDHRISWDRKKPKQIRVIRPETFDELWSIFFKD